MHVDQYVTVRTNVLDIHMSFDKLVLFGVLCCISLLNFLC